MKLPITALLLTCVSLASGFVTPSNTAFRVTTFVSDSTTTVGEPDPFDVYDQTNSSQELAIKDTVVGTGEVAETGKVLTVAYKGTLMADGRQFSNDPMGLSLRLGEGRAIPGWEKGLVGMREGGVRILRIPPNLAFGDKGKQNTSSAGGVNVPPGAHLEFECELKSIASSDLEEKFALTNIGTERAIGFAVLILLLAISPFLPDIKLG